MGFMQRFTELLKKFNWEWYKDQIHAALFRELVQIVAEVMELPAATLINISGLPMQAAMVKEVYQNLTEEHLVSVIDKYIGISFEIRNKKAYLRTMLYNVVFEYEATITNDVNINEG